MTFEVIADALPLFEGSALSDLVHFRKRCRDNLVSFFDGFVDGSDSLSKIWFVCCKTKRDRHDKPILAGWVRDFISRHTKKLEETYNNALLKSSSLRKGFVAALRTHNIEGKRQDMERDASGKKTKMPKFTRRTTSTALQIATDHAFTGTYARRFRPSDPPETTSCPCGDATRSAEHVLQTPAPLPAVRPATHLLRHPQHGVELYPPPSPIPPLLLHPGRS
ncbi:hypothetical protein EDB92DRAFT_1951851 [Lactarius akahatsu]|uniref:Uncharacterized protein n=1 Tax=Lactarius akahatsu TaxID=416441 RepID=A0AAD4L7H9_9AGAM|nr:hypothetical protein EDB92DRAFT_1951851 [Lactarius akahatsu]